MNRIVLIACAAKKLDRRARAEDLYVGPLFKYSMAYAQQLRAGQIYILSALHGLLELHKEIAPYNVTLSYITPAKRKPGLKVLTAMEKRLWAERVISQLSIISDPEHDEFVLLAGKDYTQRITPHMANCADPMKGLRQGERLTFLNAALSYQTS